MVNVGVRRTERAFVFDHRRIPTGAAVRIPVRIAQGWRRGRPGESERYHQNTERWRAAHLAYRWETTAGLERPTVAVSWMLYSPGRSVSWSIPCPALSSFFGRAGAGALLLKLPCHATEQVLSIGISQSMAQDERHIVNFELIQIPFGQNTFEPVTWLLQNILNSRSQLPAPGFKRINICSVGLSSNKQLTISKNKSKTYQFSEKQRDILSQCIVFLLYATQKQINVRWHRGVTFNQSDLSKAPPVLDARELIHWLEPDSTTAERSSGVIVLVSAQRQESAPTICTKVHYKTFLSCTLRSSSQTVCIVQHHRKVPWQLILSVKQKVFTCGIYVHQ